MSLTRPQAVADLFYPADPLKLSADINKYLSKSAHHQIQPKDKLLKALIVPHAGYVYSGLTAACAYNQIIDAKDRIKKVVIVGPSHRVWIKGLAIPSSHFFETPLGQAEVALDSINQIKKFAQICVSDKAHAQEHSLEVQLPFLQTVLNDFTFIPIVVGESSINDVAEVIDHFISKPNTLIIISSDLSHFHDYQTANTIDNETTRLIENFDYNALKQEMACGCSSIQALLKVAKKNSMQVEKLAQCNSGDYGSGEHTVDKNRVVGYASYAFF